MRPPITRTIRDSESGSDGFEQDEPVAHSLTGSAEDGDFNRTVANQIGVIPGGNDPVIVVVKKNKRILRKPPAMAQPPALRMAYGGRQLISGIPLLVIDDEADNASVNTKPIPLDENGNPQADYDVTAINGMIRQLLDTFQRSAYIGYTATPFANIFIDPSDETAAHGEGLFPRSFIVSLPAPSNYIGPERVFGLDRDPEAGILTEQDGLPLSGLSEIRSHGCPPATEMATRCKDFPIRCVKPYALLSSHAPHAGRGGRRSNTTPC